MSPLKRLLILDDEADVAQTLARMAEVEGFEVRIASTAEEMLSPSTHDWNPTHVAIDLVMPGMDGVEVLGALAEQGCKASIIVMSGMGMQVLQSAQRAAEVRGLRIAGLLPKPFRTKEVRELLNATSAPRSNPIHSGAAMAADVAICREEILAAISEGQFVLHYQPQIRLADSEIVGFEALARWDHPTRGPIYPDAFIPLAEKTGCIVPMTYHIFDLGMQWLNSLQTEREYTLAINLSALCFEDLTLADRLSQSCARFGVAPQRIILELTETTAMSGSAIAFDLLARLRIKQFHLSIDDFGTGYSSLAKLAQMPFSELKIDRSFVMTMNESEVSRTIVESTIALGKRLGLTTVAEGVEDPKTISVLKDLGCEIGQGYIFSKPMQADHARRWMDEWRSRHSATA